ncbi:hypothetical protein QE152_g33153 [Popillia japonica]|uniref:Uncharacterized protein n=1 Tax=Popillia japonica TaxID=7064 RepID=A0AAW1IXQ5_POPJA
MSDNLLRSVSSKTARRSSCKSSRSPSSKANFAPTSRSTFRSSDKTPTFLKDNIQCDVVCPGRSNTIIEIPQNDSSSKKRASPGCCAKRRPTEPPEKSLFPKCKYDTCCRDNVPPSFTRVTINQQSRSKFQYNMVESLG